MKLTPRTRRPAMTAAALAIAAFASGCASRNVYHASQRAGGPFYQSKAPASGATSTTLAAGAAYPNVYHTGNPLGKVDPLSVTPASAYAPPGPIEEPPPPPAPEPAPLPAPTPPVPEPEPDIAFDANPPPPPVSAHAAPVTPDAGIATDIASQPVQSGQPAPSPAPAPAADGAQPFLDIVWHLTTLNGNPAQPPAVPDTILMFDIKNGTLLGMSDAMRFSARYEAGAKTLAIGQIASNRQNEDLTPFENALFDALSKVATWRIDNGTLRLSDKTGAPLATFAIAGK